MQNADTQSNSRKRKSVNFEDDGASRRQQQQADEISSARGASLIAVREKGNEMKPSLENKGAVKDEEVGDSKTDKDNTESPLDLERKQSKVGKPEDEKNVCSDQQPTSEGSRQRQETSRSEAEASKGSKKKKKKTDDEEDKTSLLYTDNIMAAAVATNEQLNGFASDSEDVHKPPPKKKKKKKKEAKPAQSTFAQLVQQRRQLDSASNASSGLIDNATVVALITELRLEVAQLQQSNQTLLGDVEGLKNIVAELIRLLTSQQQQQQQQQQPWQSSQQPTASQSVNEQRLNLLRGLYPETHAGNTNSMDANLAAVLARRGEMDGLSGNSLDVDSIFAAQQRQQQQSLAASLTNTALDSGNTRLLQQLLSSGQDQQQDLLHGTSQAQQAYQQHQGGARSSPTSSSMQQLLTQASIPGRVARLPPPQTLEQLRLQQQEQTRKRQSSENVTGKKGDLR